MPNQTFKGAFLKWRKTKYHISWRMVELIGSHRTSNIELNISPSGSHMAGVSERQIKSACVILSALLKQHNKSLNDESLIILLADIESIVNLRHLTVKTLGDIGSEAPLSRINLLTIKSNVVLPPPGDSRKPDLYSRQRWRRIEQYCWWVLVSMMKGVFNHSAEYSQKIRRNFRIGDIVFLKNSTIRNQWPMAKVIDVYKSKDNHVRPLKLRVGDSEFNENDSNY